MEDFDDDGELERPEVLLVEDDTDALDELLEMVRLDDWVAHCASCIDDAIAILDENPEIGIIVTDVHLIEPDGTATNGLDLVERSLARFSDRAMSFVVLSGDATVAGTSIQTGAVDFLNKPLCPDAFLSGLADAERSLGQLRDTTETTQFLLKKVSSASAPEPEAAPFLVEVSEPDGKEKLRNAIKEGYIQPYFQPRISLDSDQLWGFEALARWIAPSGNVSTPDTFIPLARGWGLLGEVDEHLRKLALSALQTFDKTGMTPPNASLKFSVRELRTPNIIGAFLFDLEAMGIDPKRLSVNVLDTELQSDAEFGPIKASLERLSKAGVQIELSDTGTGRATLSKRGDLVLNRVKLGRPYFAGIHQDPDLQLKTRTVIALAKALRAEVLACGVECLEDLEWLRTEGCTLGQGFVIASPMPMATMLPWAHQSYEIPKMRKKA